MLEDIPGQDESDTSIQTKGRSTNRSSSSQLPKGSSGSTRRRASTGPVTSLTRESEPRGPGQGGQESSISAVDTLQAYGRGFLQPMVGETSSLLTKENRAEPIPYRPIAGETPTPLAAENRAELIPYRSMIGAPYRPMAGETPTLVVMGNQLAPPEQSIWGHHLLRGSRRGIGGPAAPTSTAYTDTRVLPIQQRVRPARREPIVILPTPERV